MSFVGTSIARVGAADVAAGGGGCGGGATGAVWWLRSSDAIRLPSEAAAGECLFRASSMLHWRTGILRTNGLNLSLNTECIELIPECRKAEP